MKIIHDMPAAEYHARPELSNSGMSKLKRSPAHFDHYIKNGSESTDAMDFGAMFHMFVLEPAKFLAVYEDTGCDNKRTSAYKKAAKEIEEAGKVPLENKTISQLDGMFKSMLRNDSPIKAKNEVETSVFYHDNEVDCKCRIDWMGEIDGQIAIIDLKTTNDASPQGFRDSVYNYGYHRQQAHYQRPFELFDTPRRFLFWAIEKEPPYLNAIYELDEAALIVGRAEREKLMATYRTCRALDKWPGLPTGIQTISLPDWAFKENTKTDN